MRLFAFGFLIFVPSFLMRLYAFCCIIFLRDFMLRRFHAFLPLWDVLMKFVAFCRILFWWDFLMRFRAFWPLCWEVVVRLYAFCCTIFARDILMRWHAFLGRYELCVWEFILVWPWCDFLMRFPASWLPNFPNFPFWWCDVRTGERWMLKGAEIECTRWLIVRYFNNK